MKLIRGHRSNWIKVYSFVFALQFLVSSFCIASPVVAVEAVISNHCHQSMGHSNMMKHGVSSIPMQKNQTSACTHCSSPDDFSVFSTDLDSPLVEQLITFVVSADTILPNTTAWLNLSGRAQAPPQSSTTLYTTTQRIRI